MFADKNCVESLVLFGGKKSAAEIIKNLQDQRVLWSSTLYSSILKARFQVTIVVMPIEIGMF